MDSEISIRCKADLERMLLDTSAKPTCLALSLLEDITNNFSDDLQIGSGGFAVVYKGIVGKGTVAVKKLYRTFDMHEIKFHKEVECLMKAKHKNIVRFLGYCCEAHGRTADYDGKFVMAELRNWLLCFEYVTNGSLDKYITDASCGLEWWERYHIIKGICEGLLHLHENRIIHLDLKPGNILIGDHMVPKIVDFGLSRCLDKDQTRAFTSHLYGSHGYLAPEFYSGQVAFASDIYSLGVIVVEILTGEKGYPEDGKVVENWMNRLERSEHREMQLEQVRVCTKIGIECMDLDPKKRPVARHIIDRLDITASTVETGIGCSSVEQRVSFIEEQCCQEKNSKISSEYPSKDIKELAETEEHVQHDWTLREFYLQQGQQEASGDQWSLCRAEDIKQNVSPQGARVSGSNSGVLYKLRNLDIFRIAHRRNYVRNGGPMLEKLKCVKLLKKWEVKQILKDRLIIGNGGFGEVYKGLVDNEPVVIKKLNSGTVLKKEQFANEISMQSHVCHKNIVNLIGVYLEVEIPMLVYEFLSKGSLHAILHRDNVPLNLGLRLSIAAESADAIAFMHSMASITILHGNIKPSKILFDQTFVPKISDFGLSKIIARDYRHSGIIAGDMVYMDPVYLQTGLLTKQSDVYSFGVVILELLTRKEATHSNNNSLVRNFLENHKKGSKSAELFDKEISLMGDLEVLDNMAEIAVQCLNLDADLRPTMIDVAERLSILNRSRMS